MTLLINPGSNIATDGTGWTNTFKGALKEAQRWLTILRDEGISDVEIVEADPEQRDGRWTFTFEHKVTGARVALETHGIDDLEAYGKRNFNPRTYWKGSSSFFPSIDDFAAPGFRVLRTYVPEGA